MDISIRGALGTQLFEYLSGVTQAKKLNRQVARILINAGGNVVDTVKIDWLSQIIKLDVPIEIIAGKSKQNVWKSPSLFKDISDNKSFVNSLQLTKPIQKNNLKILHVRGTDRTVANINDYVQIAKSIGPDVKFIGDDDYFIDDIQQAIGIGENISSSAIDDWYKCIGASELYCAFTNFTLSAMLFDPTKKFAMLDRSQAHGTVSIADQTYDCVQQLFDKYFTNAIWLYKE